MTPENFPLRVLFSEILLFAHSRNVCSPPLSFGQILLLEREPFMGSLAEEDRQ